MPDVFETKLQIRCEEELLSRITDIARLRHRKSSPMIREWIWERLEEEERAANKKVTSDVFRYNPPMSGGQSMNEAQRVDVTKPAGRRKKTNQPT